MNNILELFSTFAIVNYGSNDFSTKYTRELLGVMVDYKNQSFENRVINMIPFAKNMINTLVFDKLNGTMFFLDIWNWMWNSEYQLINNACNIYLNHCEEFLAFLKTAFGNWLVEIFDQIKINGVKIVIDFLWSLIFPIKTTTITNDALDCLLIMLTQIYIKPDVLN